MKLKAFVFLYNNANMHFVRHSSTSNLTKNITKGINQQVKKISQSSASSAKPEVSAQIITPTMKHGKFFDAVNQQKVLVDEIHNLLTIGPSYSFESTNIIQNCQFMIFSKINSTLLALHISLLNLGRLSPIVLINQDL